MELFFTSPKNDKLNRKKLYDKIDSIKGLGIQIWKYLTCKQRLNHVAIKLNQAKFMLIELRYVAGGTIFPGDRGRYPDNCPRGKLPQVRVGVSVKVRISFRVRGQPQNCSGEKLTRG